MVRLYAMSAAVMVSLMLGALGYLVYAGRGADAFAPCRTAAGAGGVNRLGGDFALMDQHGRPFGQSDLMARPALVYFGYSFCPDVCPFDLYRNAVAVDILSENSHDVVPVFISLDPARDTADQLALFARNLHPAMIAATGTPDQVRAAAGAYRVTYEQQPADTDGNYLIDHTTLTYLVLPGHGAVEVFSRATSPDDIAERTACFLALG